MKINLHIYTVQELCSKIFFYQSFQSVEFHQVNSTHVLLCRQFRFTAYRQYSACVHHYETLGKQMLKRNLYSKQTCKILMINNIYIWLNEYQYFITTIPQMFLRNVYYVFMYSIYFQTTEGATYVTN